jgi:hypothetical protein
MKKAIFISFAVLLSGVHHVGAGDTPKCENLVKGTIVNITGRVKEISSKDEIKYTLEEVQGLPCKLDLTGPIPDDVTVIVPPSMQPRCREGQSLTATGPSEYDDELFTGGVDVKATEVSCQ